MPSNKKWHKIRISRDPKNGKILGVCAGLSDYFGWDVTLVRIVAIISLLLFPPTTFLIYIVLGILMPKVQPGEPNPTEEELFMRDMNRAPSDTFYALRHRFRELELKLRNLEAYVTSQRFNLDREFRDLEES